MNCDDTSGVQASHGPALTDEQILACNNTAAEDQEFSPCITAPDEDLLAFARQVLLTAGVMASEPGWHAPGIGEVHNADHSLMLFCTKANPDPEADPDYLPDDKLAERVAALLNAHGVQGTLKENNNVR